MADEPSPPKLILELVNRKAVNIDKGIYTIWGVPMFMLPYDFFATFQQELIKRFGDDVKHILYFLGFIQSYNGTKILTNLFGIKTSEEFFHLVYEQSMMVGTGAVMDATPKDEKKKTIVRCSNSPLAKANLVKYGKQKHAIDHYLRGLITGANQAWYGKDFVGIETQCQAQGAKECVFELMERSGLDMDSAIVKEQYPKEVVPLSELLKIQSLKTLLTGRQ